MVVKFKSDNHAFAASFTWRRSIPSHSFDNKYSLREGTFPRTVIFLCEGAASSQRLDRIEFEYGIGKPLKSVDNIHEPGQKSWGEGRG